MSESTSDLGYKLDILIRLQAQQLVREYESQKDKVLFLHKAGIAVRDIAAILGTSANYVSVTISRARKSGELPTEKE